MDRACELVELLGAGEVIDGVIDVLNDIPEPRTIALEPDRINALLGTDISEADMVEYSATVWRSAVDGHEITRSLVASGSGQHARTLPRRSAVCYGYNNIPTTDVPRRCHGGRLYRQAMKLENRAGSLCRSARLQRDPDVFLRLPVHLRS